MDILLTDNLPIRANYKLKIDGFHLVGTRQKLEKKNRNIATNASKIILTRLKFIFFSPFN